MLGPKRQETFVINMEMVAKALCNVVASGRSSQTCQGKDEDD